MKKFSLIILLLTASCTPNYHRIAYTQSLGVRSKKEYFKYVAIVPKGYKLTILRAGAEAGTENQYLYHDSSIFYISDFGSSLNEENIRICGHAIEKGTYIWHHRYSTKDTLTLNGKDQNGLFWKEIVIGQLNVGYINVNAKKKPSFDKALNSLKRRR